MEKGKKVTRTSVKRKKPNSPSPEPSSEEEDSLIRLCSVRLISYINGLNQFEIKIFGINNYNHPLEITDSNANTLATLQNENDCHFSSLSIRIKNSSNHGI
ncbi:5257_t:CDS:1, partial [Racocetra fulgida]